VQISTFPQSTIHTISSNVHYLWLLTILQGNPISLKIPVSVPDADQSDSTSGHQFHGFSQSEKRETELPEFQAAAFLRSKNARAPSRRE